MTLRAIRDKRRKEFKKAREEYINKMTELTQVAEFNVVTQARDLNTRVVKQLMMAQERMLDELSTMSPEKTRDFEVQFNALLKYVVAYQEKINDFAGLNLARQLELFKEKILAKKIVDEKSIDSLIGIFAKNQGALGGSVAVETQTQGRPTLTYVRDGQKEVEESRLKHDQNEQ